MSKKWMGIIASMMILFALSSWVVVGIGEEDEDDMPDKLRLGGDSGCR